MSRALFFLVFIAIFLTLSIVTWRQLVRIHPRARRWIHAVTILCSLFWPFLPLLNAKTAFARAIRATLGPPWFGWITFALLYTIFLFVTLLAWAPFHRRIRFHDFARWPSRIVLTLTIIGTVVGVYQALVPLRVEHVPVQIANLPPELEGARLALLGDLHVGLYTRPSRLEKIFRTTASLQPKAVLILGDMVDDDPYFVPKLLRGIDTLPPSLPVFAVLGNHEMYGGPREVIAGLQGSRVKLLVNEGAPLGKLWLTGVSDYAGRDQGLAPNFAAALQKKPADAIPIVMSHQPKAFDDARRLGLPLTVCAHTHGGQCGFRPLRWSVAGIFLPYHMGLYERGASQLYVNTGTGYWLLPFRLGMTPEITLIELRRYSR
ncbi:MAG: metallophosphoesterase [Acidobacteria bacterium]|nr:metallophosphoesterase [Acidobacteriota bacterium]